MFVKPTIGGGFVTPTLAWYDPSNAGSITSSAGLVTQMNDLSGQARHLTASAGQRPTTGSFTINSLNALSFGTAGNLMQSGNITVPQPYTVLVVVKGSAATLTSISVGHLVSVLGYNGAASGPVGNATTGYWGIYAGTSLFNTTPVDGTARVIGAVFNGASSSIVLDGTTLVSGPAGAAAWSAAPIKLGGTDTDSTQSWLGLIGEVLMYSSALSPTVYTAQQAYLKAKWGTP